MCQLQRIAVVGTSGCGKTTFAHRLGELLELPHVQLDACHWGPNWTARPLEEFRDRVLTATAGPRWIADGNYSPVRDLIWPRADTLVWLNYSFFVIFPRVLRRTLVRGITRQEIFSGNRESLRTSFFSRDSILLWALKTYRRRRREFPRLFEQPEHAHLNVFEFRRPREAEEFLHTNSGRKSPG